MEGKGKREERRTRRGKKAEKERIPDMLQEIRQRKKKKKSSATGNNNTNE